MTAKVLSHLRADDVAATQAAVFGLVGRVRARSSCRGWRRLTCPTLTQ
ncbi:hypothetical protein I552_0706 [Mycobacterium xenopi 3993]|nr:hypothetical protein I552_0706 [Mycobacterium xenopi 3993]